MSEQPGDGEHRDGPLDARLARAVRPRRASVPDPAADAEAEPAADQAGGAPASGWQALAWPAAEEAPTETAPPGLVDAAAPPSATAAPGGAAPAAPGTAEAGTGARAPAEPAAPAPLPTLGDLIASRPPLRARPARWGWQGVVRRATGGLLSPAPGAAERAHRDAVTAIARPLAGPRTVVVVNPKGGAHKTTAALLLAATVGEHRGGGTLAWDNNETRGTLGWRAQPAGHSRTAVDLLRALLALTDGRNLRVGDLDGYVRPQAWGHFDVLASDEDAASAAAVDATAFDRLHAALAAHYRVVVVDTGNNMRASNWQAALAAADQLLVVSTVREDTAQSAAWLADGLRATGHGDLVASAVTVLTAPARSSDAALGRRVEDHFSRLTRTVVRVPHDASLVAGGPVDPVALSRATRRAWEQVAAAVVAGL